MRRIPSVRILSSPSRKIFIAQRLWLQPSSLAILFIATVILLASTAARAADLSFEERVRAQEAIQRVYYSHQLSATAPFEEVFPRAVLEQQVREYLGKSVALEIFWRSPVTHDALRAETERIARNSRFPDRLEEIYAALDHDALLVEECFVRPPLVDHLVHSFFSTDERVHAAERSQAEALRDRLVRGDLSVEAPEPHRSVREMAEEIAAEGIASRADEDHRPPSPGSPGAGADHSPPAGAAQGSRGSLPHDEFLRWRSTLPERVGAIGPVLERDEAFTIQVVLSESPDRARVATYTVPKKSWSSWWVENQSGFPEEDAKTVGVRSDPLPSAASSILPFAQTSARAGALAADCVQAHWDNGSLDDLPSPRSYHTAVWTGSLMIVWGGRTGDESTNTGFRYDPLTDTLSPTSTLGAPTARAQHSAVWDGSEMVIWGGTAIANNPYEMVNTGGRYNPATDTWSPTTLSGAPASGLVQNSVVWTGTEMIVWGGKASGGPTRFGGRYVPATDSWLPFTPAPIPIGTGRYDHTAVWTGTEMLVWGGYFSAPVTSPLKYNPATDTWSTYSDTGSPSSRSQHGAVWTGSRMIVWGGKDNSTNLTSGGVYDPATDTWSATSTNNAPAGLYPGSFWTGSRMLIWNGSLTKQYNPVSNQWTSGSTLNAPSPRSFYSAIWTGSLMIIWGGENATNGGLQDTGARYNPAADTWTPTLPSSIPAARESHSAVWTGSLMIVWGGRDRAGVDLNTGERYDPVADSWSATSMMNAPSPRRGHTVVWTGTLMIVWGGSTGTNTPLNTGGRYNPATNSWSSTSTVSAPTARSGHTAVWSGSRMLIWGGYDNVSQVFQTGARYNPASDSWTAITTTNAPSARTDHTAVWTGSRMIVWGAAFETGGSYDPQSDIWSSISAVNAPFPRSGHSAIWTGSEMIVWGGYVGVWLYTGGRYNPQNDTWVPVSTVGAPSGRYRHTATWTGTEMVIWGGYPTYYPPAFGGRYNPATDTWKAITRRDEPTSRTGHTSVWTGTQVIVWGGIHAVAERTGGSLRFDLLPDVDEDQDGTSFCGGDCNDSSATIHPGAVEECNGIDDDCAVAIDDGFDQDGDTFTTCNEDCNDSNPTIHRGAAEICNGIDDNCNNTRDEGFTDADNDHHAFCVDCNDSVYDVWAVPLEVTHLTLAAGSPTEVYWDSVTLQAGGDSHYDLSSGMLSGSGGLGAASCLQSNSFGIDVYDNRPDPSVGSGYWYLTRARNFCGIGTYGFASSSVERSIPACP